jgi:hypothetical protein
MANIFFFRSWMLDSYLKLASEIDLDPHFRSHRGTSSYVKNISPVLALKVAMFNLHPQSFSPLLQTK